MISPLEKTANTIKEILGTNDLSLFSIDQLKLIKILNDNGPMNRDQICEALGFEKYTYIQHTIVTKERKISRVPYIYKAEQYYYRTTIYDNLTKLIKKKIVEKFSKNNGKRGRPPVFFKLKD